MNYVGADEIHPGSGFGFIVVSAQLSAGTGKLSTRQATRLARVAHFSQSAVRRPVTHGTISRPLLLGSRREKGELTAAGRVPMQDYRRGFAFPEVKARPGCTWLEVKPPTFYSPLFSQRRSDAGVRPLARPFSHSGNFADASSHPLFENFCKLAFRKTGPNIVCPPGTPIFRYRELA